MRTSTLFAALTVVASASAQGVPVGIAPSSKAPEGCEETSKSNFTIGYTLLSSMKRESAIEAGNSALECDLKNGVLTDPQGRIGSVVANYQFQFDGPPPQAGAIYTGGFSVCPNSSLAIGGTTRWWKCGSGEFYNLYERSIGAQCDEIRIVVTYEHQTSSSSSAASSSTTSSSGSASTSAGASTTSGASNGTATATATSASGSSTTSSSTASSISTKSAGATGGATGNSASSSGVPPAPAAGAAYSIRVPGAEMLGAVIGIFGAALLL